MHTQTHVIDGARVVLVHVDADGGGPLPLIKDGIYHDAKSKPVYEFRRHERFIRDGTSNALFTGDRHQISLLLNQAGSAAAPASDPSKSMTFDAPLEEVASAGADLVRSQDDVPLRMLLGTAEERVRQAVDAAGVGRGPRPPAHPWVRLPAARRRRAAARDARSATAHLRDRLR